jgi:hypothetical protein
MGGVLKPLALDVDGKRSFRVLKRGRMTLEVVHTSVIALFVEETFCILYFADVLNLGTIRKEMMTREKVMTRGQMMTSERVSARRDKYFFPVGLNSLVLRDQAPGHWLEELLEAAAGIVAGVLS